MLVMGLSFFRCGEKEVVLEKQAWIDLPQEQWPLIAMTNHIQFRGHEYLGQSNGFLINAGDEILAVTSKHWFLVFQWHVRLSTIAFRGRLESWEMYPKDYPGERVVLDSLLNENPQEKVEKESIFETDWLVFRIAQKSDSIFPLMPRFSALKKNERIFIIGWQDNERNQPPKIYSGRHVRTEGNKYVVDMEEQFPGLSGAPVLDEYGYLVGVSSASFKQYSWVNSTRYLKEVLESAGIL